MFDLPEAEPGQLFVDPFAVYGVSPMQVGGGLGWWRVRCSMGCQATALALGICIAVLDAFGIPCMLSPAGLPPALLLLSPSFPPQWEALQEAGRAAAAAGQDPWMALRQQGVQASEAAFVWLSPQQLEILTDELRRASNAFDASAMEAAAFFVSDCLMRARVANNRVGAGAGRW